MVGFPIKHGDFPYLSYQRLIFGCLWDPQDLQETEFSTASGTWAVFLIYLPSWFMLSHNSQGLFAGSRCPARWRTLFSLWRGDFGWFWTVFGEVDSDGQMAKYEPMLSATHMIVLLPMWHPPRFLPSLGFPGYKSVLQNVAKWVRGPVNHDQHRMIGYPLVITDGNGKSPMNGGVIRKINDKWSIVHYHVWLPEGMGLVSFIIGWCAFLLEIQLWSTIKNRGEKSTKKGHLMEIEWDLLNQESWDSNASSGSMICHCPGNLTKDWAVKQ